MAPSPELCQPKAPDKMHKSNKCTDTASEKTSGTIADPTLSAVPTAAAAATGLQQSVVKDEANPSTTTTTTTTSTTASADAEVIFFFFAF